MSPQLPDDIISEIVSHISDDQATLSSMSRVENNWLPTVQVELYRNGPGRYIKVDGHEQFLRVISDPVNENLAQLVRAYRFGYLNIYNTTIQQRLSALINLGLKAMKKLRVISFQSETRDGADHEETKFLAQDFLSGCEFPDLKKFSWFCTTANAVKYLTKDRIFLEGFLRAHSNITAFFGDSEFTGTDIAQRREVLPKVESIGGPLHFLERFFEQREDGKPVRRLTWDLSHVTRDTNAASFDPFFARLEEGGFGANLRELELLSRRSSEWHPQAAIYLPSLQRVFPNIETLILSQVHAYDSLVDTVQKFPNLERLVVLYASQSSEVGMSVLKEDCVPKILNFGTVKQVFLGDGHSAFRTPLVEFEVFSKIEDGNNGVSVQSRKLGKIHKTELHDFDWAAYGRGD